MTKKLPVRFPAEARVCRKCAFVHPTYMVCAHCAGKTVATVVYNAPPHMVAWFPEKG
jgi:hypothetical protein